MRMLFVCLMLICNLLAIEWSGKVNWAMGYEVAQNIAASENKLIMVDIALTNCPPCKYMATKVYTDEEVSKYINKNFVPVFYLADQDTLPTIVQNYFTGSTPTILFLNSRGKLVSYIIGMRPPKVFLQTLQNINDKYKGKK